MINHVKTLVTLVAISLSFFALPGYAQKKDGPKLVIMGKIDLPSDIKHDKIVDPIYGEMKEVPVAEFKKIADSRSAKEVQLHGGFLCQKDPYSEEKIVPVEYKLTYVVQKGDDWYSTTIDMSKEIKPVAERNYGRNIRGEAICRLENNKVYVRFQFVPPKG